MLTPQTPGNIAEEYKSLVKVIQGTETFIAIDKIQAEGSIALARLEEEKKVKVSEDNISNFILLYLFII